MGQKFHRWPQKLRFPDNVFVDAGLLCRMTTQLCLICRFFSVDVRPTMKSAKIWAPRKFSAIQYIASLNFHSLIVSALNL